MSNKPKLMDFKGSYNNSNTAFFIHRHKEVEAIKAEEAKTKPSAEVLKARYEARKLLCQTCENSICPSGCVK